MKLFSSKGRKSAIAGVLNLAIRVSSRAVKNATLLILFLGLGCDKKVSSPVSKPGSNQRQVVATVGDASITLENLQRVMQRRSSGSRESVLDDLVNMELFFQHARLHGYETNHTFQSAYKEFLVGHYRNFLESASDDRGPVSEKELREKYETQRSRFSTPEKVHVAMVFLPLAGSGAEEKRAEAQKQMAELRALALREKGQSPTFAMLASKYSSDPGSRYRGGDIGWFNREEAGAAFNKDIAGALFELGETGALSPLVQSEKGLYIFKLIERRAASMSPFSEVREMLDSELRRERQAAERERLLASLKKSVPVQLNLSLLDEDTKEYAQKVPPSLPGK